MSGFIDRFIMASEEENYKRCLELLTQQWPDFVERIDKADVSHLSISRTVLGEFNILHQYGSETIPIHSQEGALKESEMYFINLKLLEGVKTIFFYGLGAGYDYLAAKQWLAADSERLLIIIEDDYGIIKAFFNSDLAVELLSNPQVLLIPSKSRLESKEISFPPGFEMILYVGLRETYIVVFSKHYKEFRPGFCQALQQYIHIRIQDFIWLFTFSGTKMVEKVFTNVIYNLHDLPKMTRGQDIFEKFKGIPSLICAAGPSIKKQLSAIKKLKNRAIIFGAGTGMNTLNTEGIIPHFGCGIDPNPASESRMLTNTAFSVPYFETLQFNRYASSLIHGERMFIRGSESYGAIRWMVKHLGLDDVFVDFNISTTCACLALACKMKCSPLVFLGLDLSYTDNKRYFDGISAHPTDKPSEAECIKGMPNERLIPMVNSQGNRIFTRSDWISEGTYYSLFAKKNTESKILNATVEGLDIKGIESKELSKVEEEFLVQGYDLDNWVHAELMLTSSLSIKQENVEEAERLWRESLERGEKILRLMIKDLLVADEIEDKDKEKIGTDEFKRLKDDLKKEIIYSSLIKEMDYAFEKKKMRDIIFLKYHAHLLETKERYQLKLMTELYRLKYQHQFVELQLKVMRRFEEGKLEIVSQQDLPDEQPSIPSVENVFQEGRLVISDPGLGLYFEDAFSPEIVKQRPENVKEEAHFVYASLEEGVPEGECLLYDGDGWLKGRWFYKKGKLHGPSRLYGPQGEVLAEGWFFEDERQGINLQYYPSGKLYSIQRFKNGMQQGMQEFFYENGRMKTKYFFSNGFLDGKVELYYANGNPKRELSYLQGKRHGIEKHWLENGLLVRVAEYDHEEPVGTARHWYRNGQLKTERVYLDKEGNFDFRRWNRKGKLIRENIYLPEEVSKELVESQSKRSSALEELRKKMEGLVDGQNS